MTPGSRTNSNEITFWLDEYSEKFQDQFCICGFYSNSEIVGFVEFIYLKSVRLIFFDYLVLHESHRSHGEYFQFARMIRDYIDEQGFEFDYMAAEVAFETGADEPTRKSKALVELFQQIGFSVAHCDYFQPPLGVDNPQSDTRAFLLVWARGKPEKIKRETLLTLVHAIFFDHYERWYSPFISNLAEYHRGLKKRIDLLSASIGTSSDIVLDGIPLTELSLPPVALPRLEPVAIFPRVLGAIALVWILFLGLASIEKSFGLTERTVAELAIVSLAIFVTTFALYSPQGERILKLLLKHWRTFFRREK